MRWGKRNKAATEADRLLHMAIEAVRHETPLAATPMSFLRTRVEARLSGQPAEERIMARVFTRLTGHKKLMLSTLAAAGLLLVAVLVPFSYTRTVGYQVSFNNVDATTMASVNDVTEAVKALGYDGVSVRASQCGEKFDLAIMGLPTLGAAREASVAFASLTGSDIKGAIEPIEEAGSGTLYAQVKQQITCQEICVDINEGMTDSEIEAMIMQKLADQGYTSSDVKVSTCEDGQKRIEITVGEEQ